MQTIQQFLIDNNLSLLDLGGTFVGLFYIYYQFRVSWKLWVASFVMSLFYIALNVQGGLYALTGIYVYYCCAAVYGLWQWRKKQSSAASERPITHIPAKLYPRLLLVIAVLTLMLSFLTNLLHEADSVPLKHWGDAFTSAVSIVSMWLLAKKYCEQWLFWFVVDAVNCALYAYLGSQYIFSTCLFAFYAVTCFFGYPYWLKQMKRHES